MMVGSFVRLAAAAFFSILLAGCGGTADLYDDGDAIAPHARAGNRSAAESPLQCVPYAREQSGVQIYGDAYTWWDQSQGRYAHATVPSRGSVMVLYNYAGPARAHVAVVKQIVNPREIRIDHANWLDDGAIYTDDPVRDVSPDNDWTQVRVFNIRNQAWGGRVYQVQGFIGPGPAGGDVTVAQTGSDVRMAQNPALAPAGDPIARLLADQDDLAADEDDLINRNMR